MKLLASLLTAAALAAPVFSAFAAGDAPKAAKPDLVKGEASFTAVCAACHGADGKGNLAIGAPNLTDKIWLFGGSADTIMETIRKGRNTTMPAFAEFLGDAKVHVLAAYVWSLSNDVNQPAAPAQEVAPAAQ